MVNKAIEGRHHYSKAQTSHLLCPCPFVFVKVQGQHQYPWRISCYLLILQRTNIWLPTKMNKEVVLQ